MNSNVKTAPIEVSIIVPCLNEEKSLGPFLSQVLPLCRRTFQPGCWEIIFVNDGSTDSTEEIVRKANLDTPEIWGISLTRNFGHQPAIFAGLNHSNGRVVAFLDADLQDPPETLAKLIQVVLSDEADVAYGIRTEREASLLLKYCYHLFYRLMGNISEHPWQIDAGDFCAMNRKAVGLILSLPESDKFLRGLRSWIGLRQVGIAYARPKREHGVSKYNFSRLFQLAMKGIVGFSTVPLRLASFASFLLAAACGFSGIILLINRIFPAFTLFGYNIGASPGIATIAILQLFIATAVMASLGIIGEYLSVLLIEVKRRPQALVSHLIKNEQ